MRKKINVLWLDDNSSKSSQSTFSSVLQKKGYECRIIEFKKIEEAKTKISSKEEKIDFFVSDYNLGENTSGLDFLVEIRKGNNFKQFFLLYSGVNISEIRKSILSFVKHDNSNLDYLSNYTFYSTADYQDRTLLFSYYSRIIDEALARWNEFSALKGEYATINSLADSIVRKILSSFFGEEYLNKKSDTDNTYSDMIENLNFYIGTNAIKTTYSDANRSSFFEKWKMIRLKRNALEHNIEQWDSNKNDYYIELDNIKGKPRLYESEVGLYRKELVDFSKELKMFFEDLISYNKKLNDIKTDKDYINL